MGTRSDFTHFLTERRVRQERGVRGSEISLLAGCRLQLGRTKGIRNHLGNENFSENRAYHSVLHPIQSHTGANHAEEV